MATFLVNTTVTVEFIYYKTEDVEQHLKNVARDLWGDYPFEVTNLMLEEKFPTPPHKARAELVRLKEHPGIEFAPLD
jgi:hypothetical protein